MIYSVIKWKTRVKINTTYIFHNFSHIKKNMSHKIVKYDNKQKEETTYIFFVFEQNYFIKVKVIIGKGRIF